MLVFKRISEDELVKVPLESEYTNLLPVPDNPPMPTLPAAPPISNFAVGFVVPMPTLP